MEALDLAAIARVVEANQALVTSELAAESEPIAGGTMCYSGAGSWSNQAAGMGLAGPVSGAELDRLIEFYVSRGAEPRVMVCPFVDGSLVTGLAERGFVVKVFENVLVRPLEADEDLRGAHPFGWPAGLELALVDTADDDAVELYVDTVVDEFFPAGQDADELTRALARKAVRRPHCDSFVARMGGEAVGGGGVETEGDGATLFGAAVRPPFRRRGLQLALILARLERARARGATLAIIESKPGIPTERNAQRVGFCVAYTKVVVVRPGEGLTGSDF